MASKPGPPMGPSQGNNFDCVVDTIGLAAQKCSISVIQDHPVLWEHCSPSYPSFFGAPNNVADLGLKLSNSIGRYLNWQCLEEIYKVYLELQVF